MSNPSIILRWKKLLNQIVVSLFGGGVSIFLGVLSLSLSSKLLGPEGRGELAVLMTIPLMSAGIVGLGTGYAAVHFTVININNIYTNWKNALIINLYSVPLIIICGLVYYSSVTREIPILNLGVLILVTISAATYSSTWGIYLGLQNFKAYNIKKIIPQVLYLFSIVSAIYLKQARHIVILYCLLLLLYTLFEYKTGHKKFRNEELEPKHNRFIFFKYGFKSFIPSVPQILSQRIDLLAAISVLDNRQVGLYAVSVTIGQLFQTLNASLGNVLLAKEKEVDEKISFKFFQRFVTSVLITNSIVMVCCFLFGETAIEIMLSEKFLSIKDLVPFLVLSGILGGINSIIYDGFRACSCQIIPIISEVLCLIAKSSLIFYAIQVNSINLKALAHSTLIGTGISLIYSLYFLFKMNNYEKTD